MAGFCLQLHIYKIGLITAQTTKGCHRDERNSHQRNTWSLPRQRSGKSWHLFYQGSLLHEDRGPPQPAQEQRQGLLCTQECPASFSRTQCPSLCSCHFPFPIQSSLKQMPSYPAYTQSGCGIFQIWMKNVKRSWLHATSLSL